MNSNRTFHYALMMLFGALILQLIPMSGDWVLYKPNFLLLAMIAWMLYFPDQYGLKFPVIIGIFADFIFLTTLGSHILIFSISGLILIFFHRIVVYLQLIHRVTLVFLMILSGGLVAGTKAGYAYSTWPLMGDSFVPAGLYSMSPAWLSAFENITTIQFNHRIFAYIIALLLISFSVFALKKNISSNVRIGIYSMLFLLVVQITLGISTLIFHVPVAVAAAHQVGAVALLTATLFISHSLVNRS